MKKFLYLTLFALIASVCVSCSPSPTTAVPTFTKALPTATSTPLSPTETPTPVLPTAMPTQVFSLITSVEELVGTWQNTDRFYYRFYTDGTYHMAHSVEDLDSQPYVVSKYWFELGKMFVEDISVSGVPSCKPNIGEYEIRLLETGNIKIVRIMDKCTPRVRETELEFKPVR